MTPNSEYMCSPCKSNPIFEDSANEGDAVVLIPYNKRSYLRNKDRLHTLAVQPVSRDVQGEQNL